MEISLPTEMMMSSFDSLHTTFNKPHQDKFGTPSSSFSSDASSCGKSSPPTSFKGLRRSTLDLSQLKLCGALPHPETTAKSFGSSESKEIPQVDTDDAPSDTHRGIDGLVGDALLPLMSILHVVILVESNIRTFIDEANHHVGSVFGFLLSTILPSNSTPPIIENHVKSLSEKVQQAMDDEPEPDELLTPARVTPAVSADSKDEWGHFADFQEELADENVFLPSCKPNLALGTLDESEEEEDDDGMFF
jgi:hypothetical protein